MTHPPAASTPLPASTVPALALNDGRAIPQLGFGVFQIPPAQTEAAVRSAFDVGYRHIDTAQGYRNEKEVGAAVASSGIPRDQVWITSKLTNSAHAPDEARRAFDGTLKALGSDYVDLFLIHWPLPTMYGGDFVSTWNTLVEFQADGRARSIGVSNFQVPHLQRLLDETDVVPAVNQIEAHPYLVNDVVREFGLGHGILVEAWSPIAQGAVLDDSVLAQVAGRVGRTTAQVTLRWHIQRGDIVFPKSSSPQRMAENFALFDFELGDDDMAAITALDRGEAGRRGPHPDTFAPGAR